MEKRTRPRRKSTQKQIQLFHYMQQGMSKRQAMLKAGYAVSTAHVPKEILRTESMKHLVEDFSYKLTERGLTLDFIADKMQEWFTAGKNGEPLYAVQQRAMQFFITIFREKFQEDRAKKQSTNSITFLDWLNSTDGEVVEKKELPVLPEQSHTL